MFYCEAHGLRTKHAEPCLYCEKAARPVIPTVTPIADAFAYGRAVDPQAIALIRKLETDRAELVALWRESNLQPKRLRDYIVTKFPLDKV